jgi:hypothetical protein
VSLPTFRSGSSKPTREWFLFSLRKPAVAPRPGRMSLIESDHRAGPMLERWVNQGWQITQAVGRPLAIQTNHPAASGALAAISMEMKRMPPPTPPSSKPTHKPTPHKHE